MPLKISFITEELACRNIRFSDGEWWKLMDAGVAPRWKATPRTWLFLRILLAVVMDVMIVVGLVSESKRPQYDCSAPLQDISSLSAADLASTPRKELYEEIPGSGRTAFFPLYLTSWGVMLQAVYLNTAVLATWFYFVPRYRSGQEQSTSARQPALVTVAWVVRAVVLPLSFCICLSYWILVFPNSWETETDTPLIFTYAVLAHGVNVLIQIADLPLSYEPYLFPASFFAMQGFTVVYFGWSLIHFASGITNGMCDDYLYAFLDWSSPSMPIILFFGFVIVVVPFLCVLCMVATKCIRPKAQRDMLFE